MEDKIIDWIVDEISHSIRYIKEGKYDEALRNLTEAGYELTKIVMSMNKFKEQEAFAINELQTAIAYAQIGEYDRAKELAETAVKELERIENYITRLLLRNKTIEQISREIVEWNEKALEHIEKGELNEADKCLIKAEYILRKITEGLNYLQNQIEELREELRKRISYEVMENES